MLNTVGQYDGIVEGYINNVLALQKKNLRLRRDSGVYVEYLRNYLHFGGNTEGAKSQADEVFYFDDQYVWVYKENKGFPTGLTPATKGLVITTPNWDNDLNEPIHTGN